MADDLPPLPSGYSLDPTEPATQTPVAAPPIIGTSLNPSLPPLPPGYAAQSPFGTFAPPVPETFGPPFPTAPYGPTEAAASGRTLGLVDPVRAAAIATGRYLAGKTPDFDYPQAAAEVKAGREVYQAEHPYAFLGANLLGSATGPAGGAVDMIKNAPSWAKLPLSVASGGIIGGVQGATEDTTSIPAALQGAKTGAEWGGGTSAVFPAVGYVGGKIFPELTPAAQTLRNLNITPLPGVARGGLPGAVESTLSTIPVVGAPIVAAREQVKTQLANLTSQEAKSFNLNAVNHPLAIIGEKLNPDTAPGHDAIAELQTKLSDAYGRAVPTAGGAFDAQASTMLNNATANAKLNYRLTDDHTKQFGEFVQDEVLGKVQGTTEADATSALTAATKARVQAEANLSGAKLDAMRTPGPGSDTNLANATQRMQQATAAESQAQQQLQNVQMGGKPFGTLSGQDFQNVDRKLGDEAHRYLTKGDADQEKLGEAYLDLQGQLRDWLERASPTNATDLQNANLAWRTAKPVLLAARASNASDGIFTPQNLYSASRTASSPSQFAAGGGLMQAFAADAKQRATELADAAKSVGGPSSAHGVAAGVTGGVLGAQLLEHAAELIHSPYLPYLAAGIPVGYSLLRGAYSDFGRRAATGLLSVPASVPPIMRSYGPVAGQLASGLLTNPPTAYIPQNASQP